MQPGRRSTSTTPAAGDSVFSGGDAQRKGAQRGFTLIETIVTVAVLGIVLVTGVPSLAGFVGHQRATTALDLLRADIALARNTAVMKSKQVIVCPGGEDGCRADNDWAAGWVVFLDADKDRAPDAPTDLLSIGQPPASTTLTAHASRRLLRYQADGRSAGTNLTVRFCNRDKLVGEVRVNNSGRARSTRAGSDVACPAAASLPP